MTKRPLTFEQACARYVHRYTMEHVPQWARVQRADKRYNGPHYATDREWYDNTAFDGESDIATDEYCYSRNQAWPLGVSICEAVFQMHFGKGSGE